MSSTPASIHIHQATVGEAQIVVELVQHLLVELGGFPAGDRAELIALCEQLLAGGQYRAFLASNDAGKSLGVLTVCECSALYVAGRLGWIQELYVVPKARSLGVGQHLIAAALAYGRERGLKRLEVNTPDVEQWPRTVAFYRREGFLGGAYHLRILPG